MSHRRNAEQTEMNVSPTIGPRTEFSFAPELLTAKEVAAINRLLGVATDASS